MRWTLLDSWMGWGLRVQGGGHIDIAEGAGKGFDWSILVQGFLVVVGLAVAAGAAYVVLRWFRQRTSSASPAPVHALNKDIRRRVAAAQEAGDFEAAGDLLSRVGAHEDAAESYAKGSIFLKAARSFQASGNLAQAIHFYKQAGEMRQAARLYADAGEHMAAAAEFVQAGDAALAAEQYAQAGDWRRAAEHFERVGEHLKAGEAYEAAGVALSAAENYSLHFDDRLSRVSGDVEALDEDREYARKAGMLFQEAGEAQRAGSIFQLGGFWSEAAACLRNTGDYTAAADLLMKAQQPELAAQVLEEAGEQQKALRMRGEAALREGQWQEAAVLFRDSGEYARAAELFDQAGAPLEAAECYEKAGEPARALALYEAHEKWAHAARCAESTDDWVRAADLYQQAGDVDGELRALAATGDYFRAGRLQFEHRRYNEALDTLGQIDSRDAIYPRGLELQGDVLRAQNRFEKAYSRYRAALGNRGCDRSTLLLFYKMARSLEDAQDFTGAQEIYHQILDVDKNFEDVSLRLRAIRKRLRRSTVPGAATSGIFAQPNLGGGPAPPRYEIVDEIARGGMGIVYQARDTVLGRIVAFKILGENLRDNETAVKYFLREARAAAALSHPNIVTIFDAGEQEGEYYMAMEYVEGTTLKEYVKRKGALPEDQVRFITINCCRALQYAHSKGVIHRDIKSGNVMITRDKTLKIMDFGLAKFLREYQRDHTQQVGTPFYMSPEQIIGRDIDFRSDLYSLGCTLFECATGTVPFFKGDLSYHHVHTKPPTPRSINPALSREMEKIILKLLEKDPNQRYQTAQEILDLYAERG